MKKYLIYERKAGAQIHKVLDLVPIWADTDTEAAEQFTQWALNWLQNRDGQEAEDLFLELSVRSVDSFYYNSCKYCLGVAATRLTPEEPEEEEPEPDPLISALEWIAKDENISQAFRDGLRGLSL